MHRRADTFSFSPARVCAVPRAARVRAGSTQKLPEEKAKTPEASRHRHM
jgi:hypothetical protein